MTQRNGEPMRHDTQVCATAEPMSDAAGFTVRDRDSAPVDDSFTCASAAFEWGGESPIEHAGSASEGSGQAFDT